MRFSSGWSLGVAGVVAAGVLAAPSFGESGSGQRARIVSVTALPSAVQHQAGPLSAKALNTVTASTALGFVVKLHTPAAAKPTSVTVVLTLSRRGPIGGALVLEQTLGISGPAKTQAVTFTNFGAVPFATRTDLKVSIPTGNTKDFPVIFSLPSGNTSAGISPSASISGGKAVVVPEVVGVPEMKAISALQARGLEVLVIQVYAQEPVGQVVAQAPGQQMRITQGSVVKINVSRGKKRRG